MYMFGQGFIDITEWNKIYLFGQNHPYPFFFFSFSKYQCVTRTNSTDKICYKKIYYMIKAQSINNTYLFTY